MIHVITPAFGRAYAGKLIWPRVRERAGMDIYWIIVVDGNRKVAFHEVQKNINTAKKYADEVLVMGAHSGNGATIQKGSLQVARASPRIILDADILPSQDFSINMYEQAQSVDDGYLGALHALLWNRPIIGVTLRKAALGQALRTGLYYLSAKGQAAIADHTTDIPLGGYEALVARKLKAAGLWAAYTELARKEEHVSEQEPEDHPYRVWSAPYTPRLKKP